MTHQHDQQSELSHEATPLSRRAALKTGAAGLAALLSLSHMTPALANELARLANDQPMTGVHLAEILRAERAQWNALLAQVGPERMEIPGIVGEWSVKQLVAHLTWYEQAIVEGAQQVQSTGKFSRRRPDGVSMDDVNTQIAAESQERPLSEVLAEAESGFGRMLAVIQFAPTDMLNDPRLLGLPDDVTPWMAVANNSYAHYREHEPELRAWLASHPAGCSSPNK